MRQGHLNKKDMGFYGKHIMMFLVLLLFISPCLEMAAASEAVGKFTAVEGKVDVLSGGSLPARPAVVGDDVYLKDAVRTKSGSSARILFNDGNVLTIEQRSRIDISEYFTGGSSKGIIKLSRGRVNADVRKDVLKDTGGEAKKFEIHTPTAVAGVRGTCYAVSHVNNISYVISFDRTTCPDPGTVYVFRIGDEEHTFNVLPGTERPVFPGTTIYIPLDLRNLNFKPGHGSGEVPVPFLFPGGMQGDFELIDKDPLPPGSEE
ncbi:MAG: FecR domain-containing protein [Nitrospirae bacterium]|nr:FecR domain-containing protein [Nitrospirota bacterium]